MNCRTYRLDNFNFELDPNTFFAHNRCQTDCIVSACCWSAFKFFKILSQFKAMDSTKPRYFPLLRVQIRNFQYLWVKTLSFIKNLWNYVNKTTNLGQEQQQQQQQHNEDDDKWGGQHSNQWTGRLVDSNQIAGFRRQHQWEHAIFGLFSTTATRRRRRRIGGEKHFNTFKQ